MSKLHEKAQAQVKQMVGQMIGDDELVLEGKEQQQRADHPQKANKGQHDPNRDEAGSSKKPRRDPARRKGQLLE